MRAQTIKLKMGEGDLMVYNIMAPAHPIYYGTIYDIRANYINIGDMIMVECGVHLLYC